MSDLTPHIGEVYLVRNKWKWIDHSIPSGLQPGDKIVISKAKGITDVPYESGSMFDPYEYLDQCGQPHRAQWLDLFNWLDGPL